MIKTILVALALAVVALITFGLVSGFRESPSRGKTKRR
ncbi:hypothetical protein BJ981_001963 [Sphaerisporangium krabiense]|uniref:Uncharacterized protein n=1 Tax=Sphaerisporangium krabiense TaxID=763782 RepID=A0A7W8Z2K2_9ACTN|nr:hypothetical protein [Sphaerisporangium krabiense]